MTGEGARAKEMRRLRRKAFFESQRLHAAGGETHPHFRTAVRRIARALYWDYALGDEFYPQFQQNIAALLPLLDRLLAKP